MFNHHARALGLHGRGRRRRAADGPVHRDGRPERGDRHRGADRARGAPLVRIGTCGALADELELGDLVAARSGACRPTARARRSAPTATLGRTPSCSSGWWRPARGRRRSSAATSSTTRAPAPPTAGASAAPRWSRWRRRRSSRSASRRGVAAGCVLAVTDVPSPGGAQRADAEQLERFGAAVGAAGYAAAKAIARTRPSRALAPYSVTVRRSCARGTGSSPGATDSRSAAMSRAISSSRSVRRPRADSLRRDRREPLLEPVERVLDPLEPLRHRAQPPREPLDVGRRRDVERPHRDLLRLDRLLASLEGARDRAVDDGVRDQLLGDLAEGLLALAREPSFDALVLLWVGHARQGSPWTVEARVRDGRTLTLKSRVMTSRVRSDRSGFGAMPAAEGLKVYALAVDTWS